MLQKRDSVNNVVTSSNHTSEADWLWDTDNSESDEVLDTNPPDVSIASSVQPGLQDQVGLDPGSLQATIAELDSLKQLLLQQQALTQHMHASNQLQADQSSSKDVEAGVHQIEPSQSLDLSASRHLLKVIAYVPKRK